MPHNEFAKKNKMYSQSGTALQMLQRQYQALEAQHAAPAPATAPATGLNPGDPGYVAPASPPTLVPGDPGYVAPGIASPYGVVSGDPGTTPAAAQTPQQAATTLAAQQAADALAAQQAADALAAQQAADAQAAALAAQQAADAQAAALAAQQAAAQQATQTFSWLNPVTNQLQYFTSQEALDTAKASYAETQKIIDARNAQVFSARDPWTGQMVPGFASQALADKQAGEWKLQWDEEQAAKLSEPIVTQGVDTMVMQNPTDWTGGMGNWGDFGSGFGALAPRSQYQAMMRQGIPGYQMPGYESMAMRGFAPAWGQYMLGGAGDDRTGATYNLQTPQSGVAPPSFANWYAGRNPLVKAEGSPEISTAYPGVYPTLGVGGRGTGSLPGWNRAVGLSGQVYGESGWNDLAAGNLALSEALQEADAVQAMAMGQYYGGGGPRGGYAGRMAERGMQNLFNRWQAGAMTQGITNPAGFLNYLTGLDTGRFPVYSATA